MAVSSRPLTSIQVNAPVIAMAMQFHRAPRPGWVLMVQRLELLADVLGLFLPGRRVHGRRLGFGRGKQAKPVELPMNGLTPLSHLENIKNRVQRRQIAGLRVRKMTFGKRTLSAGSAWKLYDGVAKAFRRLAGGIPQPCARFFMLSSIRFGSLASTSFRTPDAPLGGAG
jgi:hypothetical protein